MRLFTVKLFLSAPEWQILKEAIENLTADWLRQTYQPECKTFTPGVCGDKSRAKGRQILDFIVPSRSFNWLWNSLKLILMPHILPTWANETISKKIGDYYPVFYNAFATSAQLAEMLQNALQRTDSCYLRAWSVRCSLFCYLWLKAGGYVSWDNFNILCLWLNWYCASTWLVSLTVFWNKCSS